MAESIPNKIFPQTSTTGRPQVNERVSRVIDLRKTPSASLIVQNGKATPAPVGGTQRVYLPPSSSGGSVAPLAEVPEGTANGQTAHWDQTNGVWVTDSALNVQATATVAAGTVQGLGGYLSADGTAGATGTQWDGSVFKNGIVVTIATTAPAAAPPNVVNPTTDYSMTAADDFVRPNPGTGVLLTLTLPAASSVRKLRFIRVQDGALGSMQFAAAGADTLSTGLVGTFVAGDMIPVFNPTTSYWENY